MTRHRQTIVDQPNHATRSRRQASSYKLQDAAAKSDEPLNEPSPNPEIDDDSRVMFVMFREHCLRQTHSSTTVAACPP